MQGQFQQHVERPENAAESSQSRYFAKSGSPCARSYDEAVLRANYLLISKIRNDQQQQSLPEVKIHGYGYSLKVRI